MNAGGVVVVRCLRCPHRGVLSRNDLSRFGFNLHSPSAAYVKRLRCGECGCSSVMASERCSQSPNRIAGSAATEKEAVSL